MNDDKLRMNAFKDDLNALMKKYGARLGIHMDGDTHGVYNEEITVHFVIPTPDGRFKNRLSEAFTLFHEHEL